MSSSRILFICCFLFVQSENLYAQTESRWWEQEFTIGINLDPPHSTSTIGWNSDALWDSVFVAGFNLSVGTQYEHGNHTDMTPPEEKARLRNIRYLHYDESFVLPDMDVDVAVAEKTTFLATNTDFSGLHVKDEPSDKDTTTIREVVRELRSANPNKLFLVNLFPTYYRDDFENYNGYARSYLSDTTLLQVVCFDNYYPNSLFTDNPNDGTPQYYSNLALLRQLSGSRPMWSYVLTTEKRVVSQSTDWQRAFLRISAFAPLAYGAKGLIYYTFDTPDGGRLYRDFNYEKDWGWEAPLYFEIQDIDAEVFIGRFRANTTGYYDVAVKSDSLNGCWLVKFAESSTGIPASDEWDYTFREFGKRSYTEPFIGDWDNNGFDEFLAFVRDGRLLVSYTLGGWQHYIPLQEFPMQKATAIHRSKLVVGRFDNDNAVDFCIAWQEEGERYTVRTYWDYQTSNNAFTSYTDMTCDSLLHLYTSSSGELYAFTRGSVYSFKKASGYWDDGSGISIEKRDNNENSEEEADHFWIEEENWDKKYFTQTTEGEIYGGNNAEEIKLNVFNSSHSTNLLSIHSLKNHENGKYDIYGIPRKQYLGYPALLDSRQQTTERYEMVKNINCYIRDILAPVVLSSNWVGAWHSRIPPNEVDSLVQVVNANTPWLKGMDDKLMVGLFEQTDTTCYLLVVNQDNDNYQHRRVVLRGNQMGRVTLLPRIDTGSTELFVTFRPDSMDTVVEWTGMTGGECVALRLIRTPLQKVNDDFDGDGQSDLFVTDTLGSDSIRQKVYLSSRNYTNLPLMYSFPNSTNIPAYTASADYDGDGMCDFSLLDGASNRWWFRMSASAYQLLSVVIDSDGKAIPFVGDYNNDNCADLCYRSDKDENIRLLFSDNGLFTGEPLFYNLYGSSYSTYPTCGDWNGDGVDDLSLYRADHCLLIDYSNDNSSGLGHWNNVLSLQPMDGTYDFSSLFVTNGDYDGDGICDLCLVSLSSGMMYLDLGHSGFGSWDISSSLPVTVPNFVLNDVRCGEYDGDSIADICFKYKNYSSGENMFIVDLAYNGFHGDDMKIIR